MAAEDEAQRLEDIGHAEDWLRRESLEGGPGIGAVS